MQTPGDWLREAREVQRLSLREMAKMTGFSHAYINKLELNKQPNPKREDLLTLATVLRKGQDEILSVFGYKTETIDPDDYDLMRLKRLLEGLPKERRRRSVDAIEALLSVA